MKTPLERFTEKYIVVESGCWEWVASIHSEGYGQMSYLGKPTVAHRIGYMLLIGPIPDGMDIDHLCRNRKCVNPSHLEVVSRAVNLRRGIPNKFKNATHCIHGHAFDAENTHITKTGQRVCRACLRIRSRARYKKLGRVLSRNLNATP